MSTNTPNITAPYRWFYNVFSVFSFRNEELNKQRKSSLETLFQPTKETTHPEQPIEPKKEEPSMFSGLFGKKEETTQPEQQVEPKKEEPSMFSGLFGKKQETTQPEQQDIKDKKEEPGMFSQYNLFAKKEETTQPEQQVEDKKEESTFSTDLTPYKIPNKESIKRSNEYLEGTIAFYDNRRKNEYKS